MLCRGYPERIRWLASSEASRGQPMGPADRVLGAFTRLLRRQSASRPVGRGDLWAISLQPSTVAARRRDPQKNSLPGVD